MAPHSPQSSPAPIPCTLWAHDDLHSLLRKSQDKPPPDGCESGLAVDDSIPIGEIAPSRWRSLWRRVATASRFSSSANTESDDALPLLTSPSQPPISAHKLRKDLATSRHFSRCWLYPLLGFFVMLGVVQFAAIACGIAISFFPDDVDRAADRWRLSHKGSSEDASHWPTAISKDIRLVGCHSHNDYWRPVPLFSALQAGCVGVEADVWLFGDDLYVGHSTSALTPQRTLRNLYLEPLLRILDRQNPTTAFHPSLSKPLQGVFDTDLSQSLILLVDIKTDGLQTWHQVSAQLSPLRERGYLTHYNGTDLVNRPVTVVGTGNTPFNMVIANTTYRDIFFDAPLEVFTAGSDNEHQEAAITNPPAKNAGQGLSGLSGAAITPNSFNWTNSYYASVSFKKSIGQPWLFRLRERQLSKMRAQIQAAHDRGLKVRYWALASWPRSLRNYLWRVLTREGVDVLNVDDLRSAAKGDWRLEVSDWWG
ncbi:uncharacterized protein BDW47DRAFT_134875 [Aspergillus candidus]|uniref:Altered inheritance of mitochondria protein 6 n=1 Tax=Aspergillus candidus TaxID=41067 RepID=A0A2I2FJ36_ASPCN|nr:PLC-like phosphodiesterase [Aspergillus candidus]PLB40629.1 PLC-like phosphodiesterase [Aspergillus candidus]